MRQAAILLFAIVSITGSALPAAEQAAAPAKPEEKPVVAVDNAKPSTEKSPEVDAKPADTDTTAAANSNTSKAPSPQRFVPSEQVRADFDVSFPIDI